jgi:hypothetical protein
MIIVLFLVSAFSMFSVDLAESQNGSQGEASTGITGAPTHFKPLFTGTPSPYDAARAQALEAAVARVHLRGPKLSSSDQPQPPSGSKSFASSPPSRNATLREPSPLTGPLGSFEVKVDVPVTNTVYRSTVDEPSVANDNGIVFYTGNWYAALSTDMGSTWSYTNPYADMPDFCCDQQVIFDPHYGVFLWSRLGLEYPTSGDGRIVISVLTPPAMTWWSYSFLPSSLSIGQEGAETGSFDYPHISLSTNYLWITANVFEKTYPYDWLNTVIFRIPLYQLSQGLVVPYYWFYHPISQVFNFQMVTTGATDTMYWGSHYSTSVMRVYKWAESSTSIYWYDRTIPTWYDDGGFFHCVGPDGNDWCPRNDPRIKDGYVSNGVVAFFWDVEQGGGFNYPWVDFARFRQSDLAYLSSGGIWNTDFAFGYPAVAANWRGDIAVTVFAGGGSFHASYWADFWVAGIQNFIFQALTAGTNGPSSSMWGDYVTVRPLMGYFCSGSLCPGFLWIAAGFTLQGGTTGDYVVPRFYVFNREMNSNGFAFSYIQSDVFNAVPGAVTFVLPDFTGPRHTSGPKCGGVAGAQLTDYSSAGYLLGKLANTQNEVLDTDGSMVSQSPSSCGQFIGSGTIVTIASKAVNEAVYYHDIVAGDSPAYMTCLYSACWMVDAEYGWSWQVWPLSAGNDYFILEAFADANGHFTYMLYGAGWTGTLAGAVWFNGIYPNIASYNGYVYVVEWQDAASGVSHNGFPDPADTYTMLWSAAAD